MTITELVSVVLIFAGAVFFLAGTVGLLRFPDVYTRLHALTKADNVGLGLIVAGLVPVSPTWAVAAKLILIWLLVLVASASSCHLVAWAALNKGVIPWKR